MLDSGKRKTQYIFILVLIIYFSHLTIAQIVQHEMDTKVISLLSDLRFIYKICAGFVLTFPADIDLRLKQKYSRNANAILNGSWSQWCMSATHVHASNATRISGKRIKLIWIDSAFYSSFSSSALRNAQTLSTNRIAVRCFQQFNLWWVNNCTIWKRHLMNWDWDCKNKFWNCLNKNKTLKCCGYIVSTIYRIKTPIIYLYDSFSIRNINKKNVDAFCSVSTINGITPEFRSTRVHIEWNEWSCRFVSVNEQKLQVKIPTETRQHNGCIE